MRRMVWIASYPKSGNTWMRLALESLINGGAPVQINQAAGRGLAASHRRTIEDILGVDTSDLLPEEIEELRPRCYETIAREASDLVLMKVHDACLPTGRGEPLFPAAITKAAIYIVRDPRDVVISYAHHLGHSIDEMIARMGNRGFVANASPSAMAIQVAQRYLSWSAHVESWLGAALPLLLVRYEDMLNDFPSELTRVAAFLGMAAPPEAVAGAVAATRFDVLKAAERAEGFVERPAESSGFFRKGVAGSWHQDLTQDQAQQIERDHDAAMRRLGYRIGAVERDS